MPATAYTANLIAVAAKHGTAYQAPATIYLEICSDTPTRTTPGTPVVYTGYARKSYAQSDFDSDGAGNLVNHTGLAFVKPTGGDDVGVYIEAWDAAGAGAGNRLWYEELPAPITLNASLPAVEFSAGALRFSVA